jgi:hypothetical protein
LVLLSTAALDHGEHLIGGSHARESGEDAIHEQVVDGGP